MKFKGIVLAGGKSSRFGDDKALAKWKGKTLLERAVHLLEAPHLDPVVIANSKRDYSFLSCPVVHDLIPEKGPLGGLYTACSLFPAMSLLVLTCDMPALTLSSLKRLLDHHDGRCAVTLFSNEKGCFEPFPGVYESRLSGLIQQSLGKNALSLHHFLNRIPAKKVLSEKSSPDLFFNINTKQDLESWVPSREACGNDNLWLPSTVQKLSP